MAQRKRRKRRRNTLRDVQPPNKRHPHGTRARYVSAKCRCDKCRAANAAYYHKRKAEMDAMAREHKAGPSRGFTKFYKDKNGKQAKRSYKNGCPGVNGEVCRSYSSLRKDSVGGICGDCIRKLSFNGIIDAAPARKHIRALSRKGIGRDQVADASGVSLTVIQGIRDGSRKRCRASTLKKILDVDLGARADASHVDARPTWKLINKMLAEDYTQTRIAKELGSKAKTPALQIRKDKVLARTALAVERVYARLMT